MVKPRKIRNVLYPPGTLLFKPQGIKNTNLDYVTLTVDEYEAVRLADHQRLKQEEASKKMNISRPTFTRLIDSARKKIAEAIVNGKAIKIEGGNFMFLKNRIKCSDCGNVVETGKEEKNLINCPECGSKKLINVGDYMMGVGHRGRRRGRSGRW